MITITSAEGFSPLQGAKQAALDLASDLTSRESGQATVREYTIRYRIVGLVDGQGQTCEFCQQRTIKANVYVRLMNGDEGYEQTCTACVLPVIDGQLDTDPSYIVTVEQPQ